MEVGQGEAAPRRTQKREPGGAIARVQQRAGQGKQIENFLALTESFRVDRAERDGGLGFEGGHDLEQMGAIADEDGKSRRLLVVGAKRLAAPLLHESADLGGVLAGLVAAHGGAHSRLGRVGQRGGMPYDPRCGR